MCYSFPMPPLFIVFEGPDGAGTTTHALLLAERLQRDGSTKLTMKGREVVLTKEPTDGHHGKRIRNALHGSTAPALSAIEGLTTGGKENLSPKEMQELFAADRREHVATVIVPALKAGKIVICDRYVPSTIVYGEVQGLPLAWLKNLNKDFIQPDLLFLLLPPAHVAWERVRVREHQDVFEREQFQRKVHEGYARYAREHPEAIVIDTSKLKEECGEEVWRELGIKN